MHTMLFRGNDTRTVLLEPKRAVGYKSDCVRWINDTKLYIAHSW